MSVFLDTSALLALLDADEARHEEARQIWTRLLDTDVPITSSNYVLVETYALAQRRLGTAAVRVLADQLLPVVDIEWVARDLHEKAVSALISANRRELSLVDATSFEVMRQRGIDVAFAFDRHFEEAGFDLAGTE
ncbi:MAG: PIN domain-containing protein [Acidobacteriota bacterium]